MNTNPENLWSAYLDGEMSAAEAADFDKSLSPADRERFSAEIRFERSLAGVLINNVECPQNLWKRVEADISRRREGRFRPRILTGRAALAIAAAAAILIGGFLLHVHRRQAPMNMFTVPSSVAALAAEAEAPADLEQVRNFLAQHGFNIALHPVTTMQEPRGHKTVLIGARATRRDEDWTVELLYECCGEPVKVIIAREDSKTAEAIRRQSLSSNSAVQAARNIGGYRAAVVSRHKAGRILELLAEPQPS
ncbi:MAG: hypothetical protein HYV36_01625 [Lentisphaerae bacterium]|nr:hypothetical protein [Lentisphaerota bacterium]